MRRMVVVVALAAAAALGRAGDEPRFVPDDRDQGPDRIDVSTWPAEQQDHYRVFRDACNKCHVTRAINSRYSAEEWKRYLKRMLRRPDCSVNEEQARAGSTSS